MVCSSTCKLKTATGLGLVLSIVGGGLSIFWPAIFDKILNSQLVLTESSKSFELWEEVPLPMFVEFYFFNWTNPQDIYNHSTKPVLVECGPYVFREKRRKVIQAWNENNNTITFYQNRSWYFEPSLSAGTLEDEIQTIDIAAIYGTNVFRKDSRMIQAIFNLIIKSLSKKISVVRTVRELTFEGYQDPLLDIMNLIPEHLRPAVLPFDKFGWFVGRNNSETYDGLFNMYTGKGDINKFASMGTWNYENPTSYYESYCGRANGSAGELFPPKREKTKISVFVPEVCRTIDLSFKEEVDVDGIKGYRYWGDGKIFLNHTSSEDNWCFCPSGECAPHGAIDVSSCRWLAPLFVSFPHFLHADPSYLRAVTGLNPVESKHQLSADLEPRTGLPIQLSASLQINVLMQPMPEYDIMKDLPKIYFPAVWIKQAASLDEDLGSLLRLVSRLPIIGTILFYVILGLGVVLLSIVGYYMVSTRYKRRKDSIIL